MIEFNLKGLFCSGDYPEVVDVRISGPEDIVKDIYENTKRYIRDNDGKIV